ncbi:hypothetical protein HPP92_023404 [Vanilla planifolia]|uniref:Uncharacterized protein n=1 Tax=Vanilla planifolia TaxID=51239 RepID=A0A835PXJ7_VANPL|nr:hypothetical protein HPP92_023404 [Vanilla planifolia]
MESSLKPAVFDEHINEGDIHWAQKAKMKEKRQERAVSKAENVELQADVRVKPRSYNQTFHSTELEM